MTSRRLVESLFSHRPYFGPAMWALQGIPVRHAYMQAVVELLSRESRTGPFKVLEVGSWAGGSAITWVKAIREYIGDGQVVCVDAWQPYFDTNIDCDLVYKRMNESAEKGSIYGLFMHNIRSSGVANLISPMIGNSHDILPTLKKSDFSIVFLDGSHRFADVKNDIRLSLNIIREGGILCGDDLELQLSEVGAEELAEDVASDQDYVKSKHCGVRYHPGVTGAVGEAFGDVSMWEGFWAMRKTATGWVKVDLSSCKIEIPEHMATAESFSPEPADETSGVKAMIQIAKQIAKLDSGECDQNVPQLLGSYVGFNIVKINRYFYKVRQSLGPINWSLSYPELAKQYNKADFSRFSDINAMLYEIGLDDLVSYMEKLSSIAIDSLLRQEHLVAVVERQAITTNEHAMAGVGAIEAQLTNLAEDAISERQANKHEVDAVRQEAVTAHERAMATVSALEGQLRLSQSEIWKQQQLIDDLQANWAVRIARSIKRVLRGNK